MMDGKMVNDPVNHPAYYCDGGIETIDYILAKDMDFLLGQVCKYISRAGKKDPEKELEDLEKARFYLEKKIEVLKGNGREKQGEDYLDLMTAEEAFKRAKMRADEIIIEEINECIERGETSLCSTLSISDALKERLNGMGYMVNDRISGVGVRIDWRDNG